MKPDIQGKLVIIGIFGVAIAMSIYAWWHNIHTGNQVIEFFGIENATRLRHADSIDLLILDKRAPHKDKSMNDLIRRLVRSSMLSSRILRIHQDGPSPTHVYSGSHLSVGRESSGIAFEWAFALRFKDSTGTTTLIFAQPPIRCRTRGNRQIDFNG